MDFGVIKDVFYDILFFLDRVMGWLNYAVGGADDPYAYDNFFENIFGVDGDDE